MKRIIKNGLPVGLMAVLLGAGPAGAQTNQPCIRITAQVAYLDDQDNLLGGQVYVGQIISGEYRYDATTPDSNPGNPNVGDYWHTAAPWGISVKAGNLTFATDPANVDFLVEIVNDWYNSDNYLLRSYNNSPLSSTVTVDHISWQLDDPTATALSSDALPTLPPDLPRWQSWFGLSIEGSQVSQPWRQYFFRAHATEAVPCPAGACCYNDAPCAIVTQANCTGAGGAYQGDGATCTPYLCCPVMGDMNGDGVVDGADIQGFVDAMLAGFDPCADLAIPYDVLDVADVSAFVNLLLGS